MVQWKVLKLLLAVIGFLLFVAAFSWPLKAYIPLALLTALLPAFHYWSEKKESTGAGQLGGSLKLFPYTAGLLVVIAFEESLTNAMVWSGMKVVLLALALFCLLLWIGLLKVFFENLDHLMNGLDLFALNLFLLVAGGWLIYRLTTQGFSSLTSVETLRVLFVYSISFFIFYIASKSVSTMPDASRLWIFLAVVMVLAVGGVRIGKVYFGILKSRAALKAGNLQEAATFAEKGLKENRTLGAQFMNDQLWFLRAQIAKNEGDLVTAMELLSKIEGLEESEEYLSTKMNWLAESGDWESVTSLSQLFLQEGGDLLERLSGEARLKLTAVLIRRQRFQEAERLFATVPNKTLAPETMKDAVTAYFLGRAHLTWKQSEQAFRYFERATALDPALGDAHYRKALILEGKGYLPKALQEYTQALQATPTHLETLQALSRLVGSGQFDNP